MALSLSRLFSFTSWSTNHPTEQQPGDRLDAEFNQLLAGLNTVDDKVADVRRSDGALKNGIVTAESLAAGLSASLVAQVQAGVTADRVAAQTAATAAAGSAADAHTDKLTAETAASSAAAAAAIVSGGANTALTQAQAAVTTANAAIVTINGAKTAAASSANAASGSAAVAEDWADVSIAWAEYTDGKIPPNILAISGVTGDHWSSRWWANYTDGRIAAWTPTYTAAMASLHDFNKRYLGPFNSAPTHDGNGDAISPGAIYWDLGLEELILWTGSTWQSITGDAGILAMDNAGAGLQVFKGTVGGVASLRTFVFGSNFSATSTADTISVTLANVEWAKLTGKPTTISGYGITDAYTKTEVDSAIAAKADAAATTASLALKADKTYVDAQNSSQDSVIATKADTASVNTALGLKADKTYVDAQNAAQDTTIASKADAAATTTALAGKASTTYVDAQNAAQDATIALRVPMTGATGAANMPAGTTAQRPTGEAGQLRYNSTTGKFEGFGSAWGNIGGGASISDTAPSNPGAGDLWWNSADGILYVYYNDGNSSQWVATDAGGEGQYVAYTDAGTVTTAMLAAGAVTQAKLGSNVAGNGPAFSAYLGTNQTLPNTTYTKLNINTEEYDTNNCFDTTTYRFTPNVAGYYLVTGSLAGSSTNEKLVVIYKNGSAAKYGNDTPTWSSVVSAFIYLNGTTDYVELYGYMATGVVAASGSAMTYFQGSLVRAA